MSPVAKSVLGWGIYMALMGTVFILVPNLALPLFGYAPTQEIWIRIVAMLSLALAYFYVQAARAELTLLFRWKVHAHAFGVACMLAFVLLRLAPPALLLLAAADTVAGLWTALALRGRPASAPAAQRG
jgi:hypothetical protein